MLFDIDSMFESSKMLFDYCTKNRGYNLFLIDEIDSSKLQELRKYIDEGNKVKAIRLSREIDIDMDRIRDKYCYNDNLPYLSSFRQIAKELYRELKESWLIYTEQYEYVGRILKFISTSDYYIIREFLMKRKHSMFYMDRIPLDPDDFYGGYIPIEALMDYLVTLVCFAVKDARKNE